MKVFQNIMWRKYVDKKMIKCKAFNNL